MVQILRKDESDVDILLGEPKRAIRSMVIPFLVALAVVEINQFVDTYWVSGLGTTDAEAVSTVIPIYGLMMCVGLGLSIGATTTISFALGQSDKERARRLAGNSVTLGIILAIVTSILIVIFFNPIIDIMGAGSVRSEGWSYMLPYIILSPAILVYTIIGGTLRGEGAARKSTIVQISAALINMALDPVLIYGCGMGVMGAGLATALSSLFAALLGLYWYFSGKTMIKVSGTSFRFDKEASREILGVGGPKTVQTLISNATDIIQRVFLIVAGGTAAVMYYNYAWRYIGLVGLPSRALDSAMIPVCSAAYGQSDLEKMREGYWYTFKLVVLISAIAAVFLFVFADPLMQILTQEESMRHHLEALVWTIRVSVVLIPFFALMGIEASMLQAMKKAKISMYFYMLWGFIKLALYALAAYGYLGVDPFEGIIYIMVGMHVFGGLALVYLERAEFKKLKASGQSAAPS